MTDTVQLVRGVIESLTASGSATVIAVDDAHRLDDLSAFVVNQIVQRGAAKVILTLLDGEPVPCGAGYPDAGRFDRLGLQPLDPGDTEKLLSAALNSAVDPEAVRRMWNRPTATPCTCATSSNREVSDGRLVKQQGFVRWLGDPILPRGSSR